MPVEHDFFGPYRHLADADPNPVQDALVKHIKKSSGVSENTATQYGYAVRKVIAQADFARLGEEAYLHALIGQQPAYIQSRCNIVWRAFSEWCEGEWGVNSPALPAALRTQNLGGLVKRVHGRAQKPRAAPIPIRVVKVIYAITGPANRSLGPLRKLRLCDLHPDLSGEITLNARTKHRSSQRDFQPLMQWSHQMRTGEMTLDPALMKSTRPLLSASPGQPDHYPEDLLATTMMAFRLWLADVHLGSMHPLTWEEQIMHAWEGLHPKSYAEWKEREEKGLTQGDFWTFAQRTPERARRGSWVNGALPDAGCLLPTGHRVYRSGGPLRRPDMEMRPDLVVSPPAVSLARVPLSEVDQSLDT